MGPLLRWFVFNVAFGLLPLAFSVLLRLLHGESPDLVQNAPELLFFTLMLCAIQMGESAGSTAGGPPGGTMVRATRDAAFCGFLLVGILTAVVYGVYVQALRGLGSAVVSPCGAAAGPACTQWVTFQSNVFNLSLGLALIVGVAGTFAELLRMRRNLWNPG